MRTDRQEYRQFVSDNFQGLKIVKPLFYNWDFGLRFNLQTGDEFNSTQQCIDGQGNIIPLIGDTNSDSYFDEVSKRACTLFDFNFDNLDEVLIVYRDYVFKRRRLKSNSYLFSQIKDFNKSNAIFIRETNLYSPTEKNNNYITSILRVTKEKINYKNIFDAIANIDFPPRQPRLDNIFISNKEVFFINLNKKIIFNMYDDRGLDIIATNIETLRPTYEKFNDWLLDYDRELIEKKFNKNAL